MTQTPTRIAAPKRGRISAVLGPTNTGKTHFAIERMLGHETGMIGLPLRLLAREVYDRIVSLRSEREVALITGEEKIIPEDARYFVCTVESMPLDQDVSFLAVDEIQLCADPDRGHVFTDRLLHARGEEETLFLGAETMRGLIRQLLPEVTFVGRTRFSELTHVGSKKLSRLPRRSAVVAFSAEAVYGLAEVVRRQRGGAAVVMGALSPRTRNAQVELYQSGDVDYLIATDAIGMGLNMDVDHVALASLRKFDGAAVRPLRAHEIGQIAGRAGRYTNDGTFGTTGDAADIDPDMVEQIEAHRFDPVRNIQWRNRELDFASIGALIESLEVPPPVKGLMRTRSAVDLMALRSMTEDSVIAQSVDGVADLERLWSVCQIPDFRNITLEEHVSLLRSIYKHLLDNEGCLPEDWLKAQVDRLDRTDGDIDTLATRIAHIRTWTFVTNKSGWLSDAAHWQERARAVEDTLSDALHNALTERFLDRRTSHLMKSLRLKDDLISEISSDGEVMVEGHYVGRLQGFQFVADPRAGGVDGKALRAAASKALRTMIAARADQLIAARDEAIELTDHGRLRWSGDPVARLVPGHDGLSPRIALIADDHLEPQSAETVKGRLEKWLAAHIQKIIGPLMDLREAAVERPNGEAVAASEIVGGVAPLTGLARGIGYQIVEDFGVLDRRAVADQVRDLDQDARGALRRFGVRFGQFSIFLPALLKPAQARLLVILWAAKNEAFSLANEPDQPPPAPPPPGLCSVAVDKDAPVAFYAAAGFRICGQRAVRVDMLERLGDMIRTARDAAQAKPKPEPKPEPAKAEAPQAEQVPETPAAETGGADAVASDAPADEARSPEPAADPSSQGAEAPQAGAAAEQPQADDAQSGEAGATPEQAQDEAAPEPEKEPEEQAPKLDLPKGAFLATTDMMSIVGCSGEEFASILRALGYQPHTLKQAEGEEEAVVCWRQPSRRSRGEPPANRQARSAHGQDKAESPRGRGPRKQDHAARKGGKPPAEDGARGPRKGGKPRKDHKKPTRQYESRPPRRKEAAIDPDSPFAVLAALKSESKQ